MERKYETEANNFVEAIKNLANNETALENFGNYLSYHFDKWLDRFGKDPESFVAEVDKFSQID